MIYHLNANYGNNGNGRDSAIFNRMNLFRMNDIESEVITVRYTTDNHHIKHGLAPAHYKNMYDYFQGVPHGIVSEGVKLKDIFLDCQFIKVGNGIKVNKDGRQIAHASCLQEDQPISWINYFDSRLKKIRTTFYDWRGFLSSEKIFGENHTPIMEVYYNPKGETVMEKFYQNLNSKLEVTLIKLKDADGLWKNFYSEDELIALYLDSILNEAEDLVILDRNIIYIKALLKMQKKVKAVSIVHSTHALLGDQLKNKIKVHYIDSFKNIGGKVDAIVASTAQQRLDIIERIGHGEEIFSIPVGYRSDEKQIPENNPLKIVVAARFAPEKRVEHAVLAFADIVKAVPEAELHLLGAGIEQYKLQNLATELGIRESVKFRGWVSDIQKELAGTKIMLLTSVEEGFSLAIMEAISCGVPVVSYNVRYGPSDLIDNGKSGFLTAEDPKELAQKAITLLTDEKLYKEFSDAAYAKSFDFSEEAVMKKWLVLFEKLHYTPNNKANDAKYLPEAIPEAVTVSETVSEDGKSFEDFELVQEKLMKTHFDSLKKQISDVAAQGNRVNQVVYAERHEVKLEKLREKVKSGEKVKVIFINTVLSKFPEKSIYEAMVKSPLFDPYVLCYAEDANEKKRVQDTFETFKARGYQALYGYDENNELIPLDKFNPDIVFYNKLLDKIYPNSLLHYKFLTCQVPYYSSVMKLDGYDFADVRKMLTWVYFVANEDVYSELKSGDYFYPNAAYFGYPKMDGYAAGANEISLLPDKLKGKPYVVYAPHWSIGKMMWLSTFHLYYKFMFKLMEENPDIGFVFKPHPFLEFTIKNYAKAQKTKLTHEEYLKYYDDWNNMPNGFCTMDGEYMGLFKNASLLITDSASFVSEWLPSTNPCIYPVNPRNKGEKNFMRRWRPHAQQCLDTYYLANSQDEIQALFQKLMRDNIDEKKEARVKLASELFPNIGSAGKDIAAYIENMVTA